MNALSGYIRRYIQDSSSGGGQLKIPGASQVGEGEHRNSMICTGMSYSTAFAAA